VVVPASSRDEAGTRIPGGSKGMTQHGSPSAFWLYASKPVGGKDRQIRPSIQRRAANESGLCCDSGEPSWQEKCLARSRVTVPQSDTGRRVENTKAIGRTLVKELGKFAP
jgi:hypothetical protein